MTVKVRTSLVYRNIYVYRAVMKLLYKGQYNLRFKEVIDLIPKGTKSLTELCFADLKIANFCRQNSIEWTGYDINSGFVKRAINNGFNAVNEDISTLTKIPVSDVIVIMGSLYHFHDNGKSLFSKMLQSTDKILISEPVINLADRRGVLGLIGKKMTNAGKGSETFRYNKNTLLDYLDALKKSHRFDYHVQNLSRDMLIELNSYERQ